MQTLAAAHPVQATHATDLPYRLAWCHPDQPERAETALWLAGGELVGWAVWSPSGRGVELAAHPAHAAAVGPRRWPGGRRTPGGCPRAERSDHRGG